MKYIKYLRRFVSNLFTSRESMDKYKAIAYNNWVRSLNKTGFPRNSDGTVMNSWQLYDHYVQLKNDQGNHVRDTYTQHAKKHSN